MHGTEIRNMFPILQFLQTSGHSTKGTNSDDIKLQLKLTYCSPSPSALADAAAELEAVT